jgi:dipeptidyl-peptidase-4
LQLAWDVLASIELDHYINIIAFLSMVGLRENAFVSRDNRSPGFLESQFLRETYSLPVGYGVEPTEITWSPDGMRFAFLWNEQGDLWKDVYLSDADLSLRRLTVRADSSEVFDEDDEREAVDVDYAESMAAGFTEIAWLPDGKELAAVARGRVLRVSTDGRSKTLWSAGKASHLRVPRRGEGIFFLDGGNVHVILGESVLRVTAFNKKDRKVTDFQPSPNGKLVALFVEDESEVEKVRMPDYIPTKEVKINELRRHNAGKQPAMRQYGLALSDGSAKAQLHSFDEDETFWPYAIRWLPNGESAIFALASRNHKTFQIRKVDLNGETTTIYEELSEPWFAFRGMATSSCSSFVHFLTFRSGWSQIWQIPVCGGEASPLMSEEYDVDEFCSPLRTDDIFFTAYAASNVDRAFFRMKPESKPEAIAVKPGCFRVFPNEDGESIAYIHSAACVPPKLLRSDGPKMHTVVSCGDQLRDYLESVNIDTTKFISVDGECLSARLIKPRDFDPQRRYPVVLSCVYAGQGKNQFSRYHPLDAFMANELGYIIVGIDLRASIGYGKDFFFGYYESLGIVDSDELAHAAAALRELPYVDGDRIGVWGGSYGVFHTGIAWKSVTDWRNYYEWYTTQRLGNPQENAEKYNLTSPLTYIEKLEGNLLLVAGMQDDNVLFQDTVWVMQKLIESGKYFELMVYPRDDHGLTLRHESLPDLMERIAAYFEDKMGRGPTS